METNPQRVEAIKLAEKFGAAETVKALRSDDYSDFAKILKIAQEEVGSEKLVEALEQGFPGWSADALRLGDGLESYSDRLVARSEVGELTAGPMGARSAMRPLAEGGPMDTPVTEASAFELTLRFGAAMVAYFTMAWEHGGKLYPEAQVGKNQLKWLWSKPMSVDVNPQVTIPCVDFATHIGAPLAPGDTVSMVQRSCSTLHPTGFHFAYNPDGPVVRIDVVGGALNPSFSINHGN